jgi:ABC-type branched-subunit amino acid transport system ATPase component
VELNTLASPTLAGHPERASSHDAPVLELDQVSINFGGVRALDKLSLRLNAGEIRGLIGPNGSGKSTAFNVVTGLYRPTGDTDLAAARTI